MKYNGFYFWMFKGPMKKLLAEKYGKAYAAEIMKKSKRVYRELVAQADDIGDDNPMAYNELFALAFVAPYVASEKKIPPETVQEMMLIELYLVAQLLGQSVLKALGSGIQRLVLNQLADADEIGVAVSGSGFCGGTSLSRSSSLRSGGRRVRSSGGASGVAIAGSRGSGGAAASGQSCNHAKGSEQRSEFFQLFHNE